LNTGGMILHPQEIRSCLFHGPFVALIEELNQDTHWRKLFGNVSSRMRDRELILRFFALFYASQAYSKPMKEFLTRFLQRNKHLQEHDAHELRQRFTTTTKVVHDGLGERAFKLRQAVNAALCDAVMVGVSRRLTEGEITNPIKFVAKYRDLLKDEDFLKSISSGTTDEANVKDRLAKATEFFHDVP
jgi:hypothetical protein